MVLGITPLEGKPGNYVYPVEQRWCSGKDMFGGTTFGAVIETIEAAASQTLLSASVQFVRNAQVGGELRLAATVPAAGKLVTQAQGTAHQDDGLICAVTATLSASPDELEVAHRMPSVPPMDASPPRTYQRLIPGSFAYTLDVRLAGGEAQAYRMWARWPGGAGKPLSAAVLAIFADHPPYAISLVRGPDFYGLTLDSSLRMTAPLNGLQADDWVLVEMNFDAASDRFAHCTTRLWSAAGRLLGIGAQTMRLRRWQATNPIRG